MVGRHLLSTGVIGPGMPRLNAYAAIAANVVSPLRQVVRYPVGTVGTLSFAFRFLWVVPIALLICERESPVRRMVLLTLCGLAVGMIGVSQGGDWTRSLAFMFPAFMWMVPALTARLKRPHTFLAALVAAMALTPQLIVDPYRGGWVRPFFVVLFKMNHG